MLHYPAVMRAAQVELDAIVGPDRMPDWTDKPNLPYVRALINETLRWRPVAALGGMPHASTKEDVYEGMYVHPIIPTPVACSSCSWTLRYIPMGSTVFANLECVLTPFMCMYYTHR